MGEREEDPRDERPPVDVRLLRPRDLIDLRLEAPGCTIEPTDGGAELVAGPEASLVVHFPPQHLGEEVWQAGAPPPPVAPPTRPSGHVAAGPTPTRLRGGRGHPHHLHAGRGARGARRSPPARLPERDRGRGATRGGTRPRAPRRPRDGHRSAVPADRVAERPRRVPALIATRRASRPRRAVAHPPDGEDGHGVRRRRCRPAHRPRPVEPRQRPSPAGLRPIARQVRP